MVETGEAFDIFSNDIGFDVDFITNPEPPQIGMPQRKRNDRDREIPLPALVHRQTDTIHGHRALGHKQRSKSRGDEKPEEGKLPSLSDLVCYRHAVDMTGDQVAAEAIVKLERQLQIDRISDFETTQAGALQRFRRDLDGKATLGSFYHRQTGPVDGNARSQPDFPRRQMGIERQNAGCTVHLPPVNHADILDNPGKHNSQRSQALRRDSCPSAFQPKSSKSRSEMGWIRA